MEKYYIRIDAICPDSGKILRTIVSSVDFDTQEEVVNEIYKNFLDLTDNDEINIYVMQRTETDKDKYVALIKSNFNASKKILN